LGNLAEQIDRRIDRGKRHAPVFGPKASAGDVFTHLTTTCRYGSENPTEGARLLQEFGSSWKQWVTNTTKVPAGEDEDGAPVLHWTLRTPHQEIRKTLLNLDELVEDHPCQVEQVWTTVTNTVRLWDSPEEEVPRTPSPIPAGAFPVTPEVSGPARGTRSQVNVGDNPEETPRRGTPAWDIWFAGLSAEDQEELGSD
jgi:hypothetical protein